MWCLWLSAPVLLHLTRRTRRHPDLLPRLSPFLTSGSISLSDAVLSPSPQLFPQQKSKLKYIKNDFLKRQELSLAYPNILLWTAEMTGLKTSPTLIVIIILSHDLPIFTCCIIALISNHRSSPCPTESQVKSPQRLLSARST